MAVDRKTGYPYQEGTVCTSIRLTGKFITLHSDDVHAFDCIQRAEACIDGTVTDFALVPAGHHHSASSTPSLATAQLRPSQPESCERFTLVPTLDAGVPTCPRKVNPAIEGMCRCSVSGDTITQNFGPALQAAIVKVACQREETLEAIHTE